MADEYMPVTLDIDEDMEISFHTDDVMTADLGEIALGTVVVVKANYNQTNQAANDYIIGRENIVGKEDLVSVTEEILAEAKASGEFDGEDGKDGVDGKDGKDGYTPIKGIDYFDGKDGTNGKDGVNGKDGADGYTPIKGIDYFDGKDGVNGKNGADGKDGSNGKDGADGYSPIRGTDYWTDADKASIVTDVINALPTWEGGSY